MFAASKTDGVSGGYQISRSLRFNSADNTYLNRTPASAGNRQIWTISFWIKRTTLSTRQEILGNADSSALNGLYVEFLADDTFQIGEYGTSSWNWQFQTYPVYRDPSAWYHIVISVDTTQATNTNRVKIYVNNTQITVFNNTVYPSLNFNCAWNTTQPSSIGRNGAYTALYGNAYLTEIYNIDGQALTPSSFGETNAQTGVWQPKAYSGSYGTNGFYLNFSDNSNTTAATLGKDYSGNGNNWTPNNFSVTAGAGNDSLVDSPTSYGTDTGVGGTVRGNYCTWNPISVYGASAANGNLDATVVGSGNAGKAVANGTIAVSSGKFYWEVTPISGDGYFIGVSDPSGAVDQRAYNSANGWGYFLNGNKYTNNTGVAYGASYTGNDVIGVALDMDAGTLTFYKNGTSQGTAYSSLNTGRSLTPYVGDGSGSTNQVYYANFGQRPFAYTAPSGYKALCTQNLPTPTIGATTATNANLYFNPVLYTGDRTDRTITVGFQPDWVWVKSRSAADDHYLMNAVVGTGKYLSSNSTAAETTNANTLTAYTSTGFSVGNTGTTNETGRTYVAWNWKASGSTVTNTAGSITSTVSANTTSGFSVVNWTQPANGTYTIGHGLGVAPAMIIMKSRTAVNNWAVYHQSIGYTKYGRLNTVDAFIADSSVWVAAPTSSVFSQIVNYGTGGTSIAYCFAEVAGYSKFGSYTGNGSADGPMVYFGFRPAFVMLKNTTTAGNDWQMIDVVRGTYNVEGPTLVANYSGAENTYTICDFLSNGVKFRDTNQAWNKSGDLYIYMAFASNPFKTSLAR